MHPDSRRIEQPRSQAHHAQASAEQTPELPGIQARRLDAPRLHAGPDEQKEEQPNQIGEQFGRGAFEPFHRRTEQIGAMSLLRRGRQPLLRPGKQGGGQRSATRRDLQTPAIRGVRHESREAPQPRQHGHRACQAQKSRQCAFNSDQHRDARRRSIKSRQQQAQHEQRQRTNPQQRRRCECHRRVQQRGALVEFRSRQPELAHRPANKRQRQPDPATPAITPCFSFIVFALARPSPPEFRPDQINQQ